MKKQLSILVAIMTICSFAIAQQFESGMFRYNITSTTVPRTVEVTALSSGNTNPVVAIPDAVNYEEKTYIVTSIKENAFLGKKDLTSVTIGSSVIAIGDRAFSECSGLTSIIISNSVNTIGRSVFYECTKLTQFEVEDGSNSFCAIDGVLFNKNQDTLIQYPAAKADTVYHIPNTVTLINTSAFRMCKNLKSITIPNSVTVIEADAFFNSSITSTIIPNSVTFIGISAYAKCLELTKVSIGSSVDSIGPVAFGVCENLKQIDIKAAIPPKLGTAVFMSVPNTVPVYVPCQSVGSYQIAEGWTFNSITGKEELSIAAESNNIEMGNAEVVEISCQELSAVIRASINEDYRFVQWQDGNTDTLRTVTLDTVVLYTAMFATNKHTITVQSNNDTMGTVTGSDIYTYNSEAILTAIANDGYRFVQWNDGITDSIRTIVVTQDSTFTAEFALINSVFEVNTFPYEVYTRNNTLIIKQAEGQPVAIFDMMGRCIFQTTAIAEIACNLPAMGMYIVRIGKGFAKKIAID